MQSNGEYILDFVIPAGPTGPIGPSGISSLCYANFNNATSVGNMTINTNIILPINSIDYTITSNTIHINQPGYYEITFCGKIDINTANKIIDVKLMCDKSGVTTEMPGMSGQWKDGSQVIHFSQTSIYQFDESVIFTVSVSTNGTTTFNVGSVNLIIKKLPF